jgi:predicted alpha/beta superfamily hydrolase
MPRSVCFLASLALAACAFAQSGPRETILFATNQTTVVGESIYVLGDIPELGNNDITRAIKLEPSQYPNWRAPVSLPANRTYTYRFVKRLDSAATAGNPTNGSTVAGPFTNSTAAAPLTPANKAVLYHSGWSAPILFFRTRPTDAFTQVTMTDIGPGRNAAERRFAATSLPQAARTIEFYITPGFGTGRDPASGTYTTNLDAALLQDGQLFNYLPAAAVASGFRDYAASSLPFIDSTNLGERRFYRVWLPRGYNQHTAKRYPVLYMHDGQNCFEPGPFGTWNADTAASLQIARGSLRELIIVAADSNNNRFINYVPSGDTTPSLQPGNANAYLRFMRDELKPRIDAQYRTLPDGPNTGAMGSSMGGQVSMVFGWDAPTVYSRIGALSNFWSTNFRNRVTSTPKPNVRLYMDSGDSGTASDNFTPTFNVRDALINNSRAGGPFVNELDFRHTIGFGQQHNEPAWAQRVGPAMSFLFPVTEEPNALIAFADSTQFDITLDTRTTTEDAYRQAQDASRDVNISGEINADDVRAIANASRTTERTNLLAR